MDSVLLWIWECVTDYTTWYTWVPYTVGGLFFVPLLHAHWLSQRHSWVAGWKPYFRRHGDGNGKGSFYFFHVPEASSRESNNENDHSHDGYKSHQDQKAHAIVEQALGVAVGAVAVAVAWTSMLAKGQGWLGVSGAVLSIVVFLLPLIFGFIRQILYDQSNEGEEEEERKRMDRKYLQYLMWAGIGVSLFLNVVDLTKDLSVVSKNDDTMPNIGHTTEERTELLLKKIEVMLEALRSAHEAKAPARNPLVCKIIFTTVSCVMMWHLRSLNTKLTSAGEFASSAFGKVQTSNESFLRVVINLFALLIVVMADDLANTSAGLGMFSFLMLLIPSVKHNMETATSLLASHFKHVVGPGVPQNILIVGDAPV